MLEQQNTILLTSAAPIQTYEIPVSPCANLTWKKQELSPLHLCISTHTIKDWESSRCGSTDDGSEKRRRNLRAEAPARRKVSSHRLALDLAVCASRGTEGYAWSPKTFNMSPSLWLDSDSVLSARRLTNAARAAESNAVHAPRATEGCGTHIAR